MHTDVQSRLGRNINVAHLLNFGWLGEFTFREQASVDRAWSDNDQLRPYNGLPAEGIRAESLFVFPDGSIRRALSTDSNNDEGNSDSEPGRNPGVPMTLVGTSRVDSAADPSTALVASYVDNGRRRHKNSHRHSRNEKMRGHQGEDYRTLPRTTHGTSRWAPESGRPPRPYVPFLNLPALEGKNDRWSRRQHYQELRRKEPRTRYDNQASLLPSKLEVISRQRKILATPEIGYRRSPRTMTGTSRSSSSRTSYNGNSEDARGQQSRRAKRRGLDHSDGEYSSHDDHGGSAGSDSTDVEFLRRRAEAKLRSLERREAAARSAGGKKWWDIVWKVNV